MLTQVEVEYIARADGNILTDETPVGLEAYYVSSGGNMLLDEMQQRAPGLWPSAVAQRKPSDPVLSIPGVIELSCVFANAIGSSPKS